MDTAQIIEQIKSTVEESKKTQSALMEELKSSTALQGKEVASAVSKLEEMAKLVQSHGIMFTELEQKLAENVGKGKAHIDTLGDLVIKSDAFKTFAKGSSNRLRVEANTITGQEGSPPANSGTIIQPQRLDGIIPGAFRALRVSDILPQGTTSSNMIEYTRELAFTNNAAETAEGASKPESSLTFELVQSPVRTVAHWLKASKQVLDDAPALASYIDTRLRYGVEYRLDAQLLNGDGTGQNISGMRDSGNYQVNTPVSGENGLDTINRAIYKVAENNYAATAIIMNPSDWGTLSRLKVGSGDNRYIIGDPLGMISATLWGLPVVVTNAMPAGYFLTAAFPIAYQQWNRTGAVVEMFEQDDTNVQKNLLTVRAEIRATLATYTPASAYGGLLTA